MKLLLTFALLAGATASALAQTSQAPQQQPVPPNVVLSPFQALANVIRNPDAPAPQPPPTVTSEPLALPTAIPPNTVGQDPSRGIQPR